MSYNGHMPKKLKLLSLKNLEFAVTRHKTITNVDPISKIPKTIEVPQFSPIKFINPTVKMITGSRNGQPFSEKLRTYIITEEQIEECRYYGEGEQGTRRLEFWEGLQLIFEDPYVKQKFIERDLYIELMTSSNEDQEIMKKLLEMNLVKMEWVANVDEYVKAKEGENVEKAKKLLLNDGQTEETTTNSSNDSKETEVQNSPIFNQIANLNPFKGNNGPEGGGETTTEGGTEGGGEGIPGAEGTPDPNADNQ